MSNATDLLKRALDTWKFWLPTLDPESEALIREISAFLAAEPEADEPVAWIIETEMMDGSLSRRVSMDRKRHKEHHDSLSPIIPLYTRPEPARKPMSEEGIENVFFSRMGFVSGYLEAFTKGFRSAEKHHGIVIVGGDDE